MKVKELIDKLRKADPEQEVFVSPLIFIPVMQLGVDSTQLSINDKKFKRVADPDERYAITTVGRQTSLDGDDSGKQYIVLGYDKVKILEILTAEEIVN